MADKSEAAAEAQSEEMLVCVQKAADVAFPLSPLIPLWQGVKVISRQVLPLVTLFAGSCCFGDQGFLLEIHPWWRRNLQWQRSENVSAVLGQEWEQAEEMPGLCQGHPGTCKIIPIWQIQPVMLASIGCEEAYEDTARVLQAQKIHVVRRLKIF